MRILAIDPGPEESALLDYDGDLGRVLPKATGIKANAEVLQYLQEQDAFGANGPLVIEQVCHYGMPVGAEVFETVWWTGRFCEAAGDFIRVPRLTVKMHLCRSARAKDANVRQALIDRFGGKAKAIGTKKAPGPLYDVKSHLWSALALAVWAEDTQGGSRHGH